MYEISELFPIPLGNTGLETFAPDSVRAILKSRLVNRRIDLPPQSFFNEFA
jgi:hypothetical protein